MERGPVGGGRRLPERHHGLPKDRIPRTDREADPELVGKVAAALDVDEATVTRLVDLDSRDAAERWESWADEPIEPHLVERLMAAVYRHVPFPGDRTCPPEELEAWAATYARERNRPCRLVLSRRLSIDIGPDGRVGRPEEADRTHAAGSVRLGNKRISFLSDDPAKGDDGLDTSA